MKKLLVLTAGFYDRDYEQKLDHLQWSCLWNKIDLTVYGRGEFFSFYDSKIAKMIEVLKSFQNDYSHVLYTDASDSLLLAGYDEIIEKYIALGEGLIVSGEVSCYPFPEYLNKFPKSPTPFRYMNPGNFIGDIPTVIAALKEANKYDYLITDDQGHWVKAYMDGKIKLKIDYECDIFQTTSSCIYDECFDFQGKRLFNKITGTYPCVVHFNGPKHTYNLDIMSSVFNKLKEGNNASF